MIKKKNHNRLKARNFLDVLLGGLLFQIEEVFHWNTETKIVDESHIIVTGYRGKSYKVTVEEIPWP